MEPKTNGIKNRFQEAFPAYRFAWRHEREAYGDIEMDALILEAFGVPAEKQIDFVREARALKRKAETIYEGTIIILCHTPEATRKFYPRFLQPSEPARKTMPAGRGRPNRKKVAGRKRASPAPAE